MRIHESITILAVAYGDDGRLLDFATFTATREDLETIAFDLQRGHLQLHPHMHPMLLMMARVPEGGHVLAPVTQRADPVDRGAQAAVFDAIEDRAKEFGLAYVPPWEDVDEARRIATLPDRAQAVWLTWVTTMAEDIEDRRLLVAAWRAWSALEVARVPF
ncbi:hypothetical protein M3P36_07185 [Altererythrobacter sp. KTW20L]|uniref:hypothetical protein n=1 Tax=Altererythrobacter sp. KTW20L TaxID=2942210 RepID=UPI0020BF0086|nr:hypothetical protein [Altererythrobacter sp. KTW20L]MCL6250827.1 hypothetical protein [Altererythrobacter sp. KTW20L]